MKRNYLSSIALGTAGLLLVISTASVGPAFAKAKGASTHGNQNNPGHQHVQSGQGQASNTHNGKGNASSNTSSQTTATSSTSTNTTSTTSTSSQQSSTTVKGTAVQGVVQKVDHALRQLDEATKVSTQSTHAHKGKAKGHIKQLTKKFNNEVRAARHAVLSAEKQISVIETVYSNTTQSDVTGTVYTDPTTVTSATYSVYSVGDIVAALQPIAAQLQLDATALAELKAGDTAGLQSIIDDLTAQVTLLQQLQAELVISVTLPTSSDN